MQQHCSMSEFFHLDFSQILILSTTPTLFCLQFYVIYRILLLLLEPIRLEPKRGTAGLQFPHPKSKFKKEKNLGHGDVKFCT